MHNSIMEIEKLFGQLNTVYTWYINAPGTQHYAIDSLLHLRTIKDKYIQMYKEFITQLPIHAKAIRILAKRLSTYLAYLTNKIKGNSRSSEKYNKKNESRL